MPDNPHGIKDPELLKDWQKEAKLVLETRRNNWQASVMWAAAVLIFFLSHVYEIWKK
jgi:hypothetical protein